jgi:hypothetical protein
VAARTNGAFSPKQKWIIAELFVEFQQQPTVFSLGAQYRLASQKFMFVLSCIDTVMSAAPNSKIAWTVVSYALGLQSANGQTEKQVARNCGCGHGNFSKKVCEFLRITGLPPAFGLKSDKSKKAYSECHTR